MKRVEKPSDIPEANSIEEFREPIARCSMILPSEYIGAMMQICTETARRPTCKHRVPLARRA